MKIKTSLLLVIILIISILFFSINIDNCLASDIDNSLFVDIENTDGPWIGTQQYPFQNISDAIDAAGDKIINIYVASGTYNEDIFIYKTINLIGANRSNTIITGIGESNTIYITEGNTYLTGFTIQNSGPNDAGIKVTTSNNEISNNIIKDNYNGIDADGAKYNSLHNNTFISNSMYGIFFRSGSNHNSIERNLFEDNSYGTRILGSHNILVVENVFYNNRRGVYLCCGATNNIIYYNNFINNSIWSAKDDPSGNVWYNEETNHGNYWDDYEGIDEDNDGIGDTPYNITADGSRQDPYPLIQPLTIESGFEPYNETEKEGNDDQNNSKQENDTKSTTSKDNGPFIPGFEIMFFILVLSIFVFIKKNKTKF